MGLAKRIIPCLDCDKGRVVKGVKFLDIRDAGDPVERTGFVYANPAIMNNKVHTIVIRNVHLENDTDLDAGEDINPRLVPLADIPGLIADGTISHSLMVAALYRFQLWNAAR